MFLVTQGTEWPILCQCAVKQLLTHSLCCVLSGSLNITMSLTYLCTLYFRRDMCCSQLISLLLLMLH